MRRLAIRFFALLGGLFFVLVVIGAALFLWLRPLAPSVPGAAILALDLTAPYTETTSSSDLASLLIEERPSLRDVLDALEQAGNDPRIKGVFARIGDSDMELAQAQELRDAIAGFRAKGKPAVIYADSFGELGSGTRSYYLATAFDEIWLQPLGQLGVVGLRAELPFFRGTLDKLGIEPRFAQREEYKTAMNMLTERSMTPAQREETQGLIGSLFGQIVQGIAAGRKLDAGAVRALINRGPLTGREALDARLVDHIGYRDEALAATRARSGGTAQLLPLGDYIDASGPAHRSGPTIALIYANGIIQRGASAQNPLAGGGIIGADTLVRAFRAAARDKDVRAILFRIDSPGGSAVASETIWRAVAEARQAGKPVIASMGDVAGSGGYYIAAGADRIVADPATLTGSIGVVGGKVLLDGLIEKMGASWDAVQQGDNAGIASPLQDFTPAGRARFEAFLDEVYAGFKDRVATGRKLSPDAVEAAAKGRVWTGEDAKPRGLVDVLGGYEMALGLAKQAANIPADRDVTLQLFPRPSDTTSALLARLLGRAHEPDDGAGTGNGVLARLRPILQRFELLTRPAGMLTMPPIDVR